MFKASSTANILILLKKIRPNQEGKGGWGCEVPIHPMFPHNTPISFKIVKRMILNTKNYVEIKY